MSEEFDREAEKEKLRRQLEDEESSRRNTEHLSELLLKGATMTNRHCEECGDPIFRYEGREFCPTCQREVGGNGHPAGASGEDRQGDHRDGGASAVDEGESIDAAQGSQSAAQSPPTDGSTPTAGSDIEAARASIARKLTALAAEAEEATDVGRSRSLLEATREAAEALRAVDALDR